MVTSYTNQLKEHTRSLGQLNFFYTKLVEGLLRLGDDEVDVSLTRSGLLKVIVDIFFNFKYHSMAHLSVQRMILVTLDDFTNRRAVCNSIFIEYRFLDKLQEMLQVALLVPIGKRSPLIGHLIIIAQVFKDFRLYFNKVSI